MPLYEYECENCGTHFEKIQSVQSEPIRQCPECSGVVHKVFHPAGIIFKGSGWYITDSRKSTSGAVTGGESAKKDAGESNSATTTSEAKPAANATESKSETKTETKT